MAAVTFGDELVRDYLVYRGFLTALKAFDSEIKADKDRGFRPDRIVEHLSSCITNLDLNALREAWAHLEQRVFSRLEHSFLSTARKLENALLRMYLVTCISASRHDKLLDFFDKMTPELQGQSEWKEWFALPFLKNADENPAFSVFFTRQWQDTMLVSLHNFISVVFQSMAMPSLLSYEEELIRLSTLQEENELLKTKLASILVMENEQSKNAEDSEKVEVVAPAELMDDFYVIAQSTTLQSKNLNRPYFNSFHDFLETPAENVGRSIKSIIKNISSGLPASPILARHEGRRLEDSSSSLKASKVKPRSPSVPPQPSSHASTSSAGRVIRQESSPKSIPCKEGKGPPETETKSTASSKTHPTTVSHSSMPVCKFVTDPKSGFLILSQEEYLEHHSFITHCIFNSSGSTVASSDTDGVIKIWSANPSIDTITTIMSKTNVLALEWAPKRERLLLYGSTGAKVRLYDIKERRIIGEVAPGTKSTDNQRVLNISCNPTEANFAVSTEVDSQGALLLYDMRTLQVENSLPLATKSVFRFCSSFNHNGQLLLVGTSDGHSHIYDLRSYQSIGSWVSHSSPVLAIQFSSDENACYTMSQDGKFVQWSINKMGQQICEMAIHSGGTGAFSSCNQPAGKLFAFNNDADHILTCGPVGGVIYKVAGKNLTHALNIGGHSHPVTTVDWSTAMECSTCLCGSTDGKVTVTTLMTQ